MTKRVKRKVAEQVSGAAMYMRISDDAEGLRLGVTRQREDLHAYALETGLPIVDVYEDNDISASTRSTKHRPRYEAMLKAARAGNFGTIIAYTSSRLTRRPRENEDLIELAEKYGVRFRYLRSPSFDLNTADGRNIARILAANDAAEAERTAERVARAAAQRVRNGGFHGGPTTFGYEAVKNVDGKTEKWVHHPVHAEWVREAADRVLKGETFYGVVKEWRRLGRVTAHGNLWHGETLKNVLLNPGIAGLREFDGDLHPAPWDPIVSRADWQTLVSRHGPDASDAVTRIVPSKDARRRYLLSGLAICGQPGCGKLLSAAAAANRPSGYVCSTSMTDGCGRLRVTMAPLEKFVVTAFLATADDLRATRHQDGEDPQDTKRAQLQALINADEEALEQIRTDHYDKLLDRAGFLSQTQRITARLEDNRRKREYFDSMLARTSLPAASVLAQLWETKDVMWKRTMLAANIERITVKPFPLGMIRTLPRRRGESDADLAARRLIHQENILYERVRIDWIS